MTVRWRAWYASSSCRCGAAASWSRGGKPAANYWQGAFPVLDTAEDGHAGLAPVGCYAANGFRLYDMIGNAWEWTKDAYTGSHQSHTNGDTAAVAPPTRKGFGQTVIARSLQYSGRGGATLDYLPTGVVCRISIPAEDLR